MNLTVVERKTRLIGAIMVERGLLTSDQLRAALEVQAERGGLLGEIVMAEFGVSRAQVSQVIAEQLAELEGDAGSETSSASAPQRKLRGVEPSHDGGTHLPVGDALLELGLVSRDQIDSAHEVQRETGERLGEILVGQGVISRLELADALSEHWSSLTKLRAPGVVDTPVEVGPPAHVPGTELEALTGVVEGVGARLEESLADRDRELTGQFERLSARLDEVAASHELTGSRLEAIAAAQEAGTAPGSTPEFEELAGQLERLSARLDELGGERDGELVARFDGLSARFDQLVALHEQTGSRLEEMAAAQESVAGGASGGELEEIRGQFERLSARLYELGGERDGELVARFDGLSARFDQLVALHEQTGSRLEAIAAAQEANAAPESAAELEELAGHFERLSARFDEVVVAGQAETLVERIASLADTQRRGDEVLAQLVSDVAVLHEQTGARLDAIAAAQEAGAGTESATGLDELALQLERLSTRLYELVGERDGELVARFDGLSSRFDQLAALHEKTGSRLEAIATAQEAVAGRDPAGELEALTGVMAGLESTVADRDRELSGQFEGLSTRFDELARLHEQIGSRLEAIAAAHEALAAQGSAAGVEELANQFERLSTRLDELVGGRDAELAGRFEGLSARFDDVTELHEQTRARLDAIAAVQESLASQGLPAELEELLGRFEGFSSRFDEVTGLQERSEARLDAIAAAQESLASLGSAAELEALAARVEELGAVLEASVAGRDRELSGRFERLSSRLDELVRGRDEELAGRFEHLSARFDEVTGLHEQTGARLDAIAAAQQTAAFQGSSSELEELAGVLAGLEASVADRDRELRAQFERFSSRFDDVAAAHERTDARLDAIAAAQEAGRGWVTEFEALAVVVEGVGTGLEESVAGRDRELTSRLEGVSSRLDELAMAGQTEVLAERIALLDEAQRRGEEVLGRLVREVVALHEQTGAILDARTETPAATSDPVPGLRDAPRKKTSKKNKANKKNKKKK